MDIFESLLKGKSRNLTKTQNRVLTYIMDNFEDAIFLNASKIAKESEASEPTVTRLAQALGFDGYPQLQRELQRHSQYRLSMANRLTQSVKEAKDTKNMFVKTMQEDIQNISETLKGLSSETFNRAVSEIWSAHRVYILGVKQAHALAMALAISLSHFMKNIVLLQPNIGSVWDDAFDIERDDLIIGISFPRYTKHTVEILKYVHERGAKVGAITDSLVSPLADSADWVLPAKCQLESLIETYTSAMSVINALVATLSIKDTKKTEQILKQREQLWTQTRYYYKRIK